MPVQVMAPELIDEVGRLFATVYMNNLNISSMNIKRI